jgi:tellurite resistance protein TerC
VAGSETLWLIFGGIVAALMGTDLVFIARRTLSIKEAGIWSAVVVTTALSFGVVVWLLAGSKSGLEYYAGYLIELTLSVDNLFVFLLIFEYFAVPATAQRRVLSWGIFMAMVLRGLMIVIGSAVIGRFEWVIYGLGVLLIYTGIKMLKESEVRLEPEKNPIVKLTKRIFPMTSAYEGDRFFVRTAAGALMATPLFLVVMFVNWTDVVFAVDSIPAIFAVTRDQFIVFSSNILAILGLRAMFFVLADAMTRYKYLKPAVALILAFVGLKMALSYWFHLSIALSLTVIVGVLATAIVLSVMRLRAHPEEG